MPWTLQGEGNLPTYQVHTRLEPGIPSDDETCKYGCIDTEYIYWAMTSILGAQESRLSDIQAELDLNTRSLVENNDAAIYALLTDPAYNVPTVLPDGSYKH